MIFPISYIIYLNIAIIAVLLLFLWSGYKRGFLMKVIDCFSTILIAMISWFLSDWVSSFIKIVPKDIVSVSQPDIANTIYLAMNRVCVFALLFLCVWLIVMMIKPVFKTISSLPIIKSVNRILGIGFGFIQTIILLIIIVFIMQTPLFANGDYVIKHSWLQPIASAERGILENLSSAARDLKALQKIVTPNSEVDATDETRIREWLTSQGVEAAQIDEFMKEILGN